jgi:hypothetical protein
LDNRKKKERKKEIKMVKMVKMGIARDGFEPPTFRLWA